MMRVNFLAKVILLLAVVAFVMGTVFVVQGVMRNSELKEAMRVEHITLGMEDAETEGQVIDSLAEAQEAGDTIREHRRGIATSYEDLLGGGRYDPTDPKQLTYAQALNLENYLYLAVVAFGLITVTMATGGFMIVTAVALGITGVALLGVSREYSFKTKT